VRAIVTGGAGFVGSHVVDALVAQGAEVAVVDSLVHGAQDNVATGAELHVRDIREPLDDVFDAVRPEAVLHLAAQADVRVSVERPVEDADVNVLGTVRILESARKHGAQVVFSSTGGAIYGDCTTSAPEDSPCEPLSPYGTAKLAAEEYLRAYNRLYGTRHIALRYGNVYGPRQDPHGEAGVVAIFLGALARGEQARIFGDGMQTRDYVYVGDVAPATLAALGHEGGVVQRRDGPRDVGCRALRAVRARRRIRQGRRACTGATR
jgi:UDP-glucose 4-epimerase